MLHYPDPFVFVKTLPSGAADIIIWKEGTHNNNFQSQFPIPADLIWTCAKAHVAPHQSFWLAKQPLLDTVTWISHWNILLLQDNPQFHRRPLLPPLCVSCGFVRWRSRLCAINLCIYSNSGLCGFVDKVKTGQDRTACCRARASVQVSTFEIVNWEDCLIKLAAPQHLQRSKSSCLVLCRVLGTKGVAWLAGISFNYSLGCWLWLPCPVSCLAKC